MVTDIVTKLNIRDTEKLRMTLCIIKDTGLMIFMETNSPEVTTIERFKADQVIFQAKQMVTIIAALIKETLLVIIHTTGRDSIIFIKVITEATQRALIITIKNHQEITSIIEVK